MKNQLEVKEFTQWLSDKVRQKKILIVQERHFPNDKVYVHAAGYMMSGVHSLLFNTVKGDHIGFEVPNAEWLYNDNGVIKTCWNWIGSKISTNMHEFGYEIWDLEDDQDFRG